MNKVLDELCLLADSINALPAETVFNNSKELSQNFQAKAEHAKFHIRNKIALYDRQNIPLTSYLTFLQNKLTNLSNRFNKLKFTEKFPGEIIDDLLDFLDFEYESDFNKNLNAPETYIANKVFQQSVLGIKINKRMTDAGVNQNLIIVVNNFISQNGHTMKTFAQVSYYQTFCESMATLCDEISHTDLQIRLLQKLIHLNFNTLPFLTYYNSQLASELAGYKDDTALALALKTCMDDIKRSPQHESIAYDSSDKSVKESILNFASEMADNIEKKIAKRLEESFFDGDEPYFTFNLNIYEITCLCRMMKEVKYIIPKSNKFLFAFISKYIRTQNKSDILSEGSIKNKYSEISEKTLDAVIKILNTLLDKCHEFKREMKRRPSKS